MKKIGNIKWSNADFIIGISITIVGFFLLIVSLKTLTFIANSQPGAGFFPSSVSIILGFIGIFITLRSINISDNIKIFKDRLALSVTIKYLLFILVFIVLIEIFGLLGSAAIFILIEEKWIERSEWKDVIFITVPIILLFYLIYVKFLTIQLPQGILFKLIFK